MGNLDLLFFAAIAVFLGWKLYSILGKRTGSERSVDPMATGPRAVEDAVRRKPGERPVEEPEARPTTLPRERRLAEAELGQAPEEARNGVAAIKSADPDFDYAEFLGGAKVAFEMILTAFANGDVNALKPLLSPDVLQNFTAAIADRQRQKRKLKTTLIGINTVSLMGAELTGGLARITLKIVSEQVNVTEDADGNAVEGNAGEVATITDLWTFGRPMPSRDPNWLLMATESPN